MAQATNDTSQRTRKARTSATAPKPNGSARSTAVPATPRPRTRGKEATVVVPAPVAALVPAHAERSLAELEAIIDKHKLAFMEVGQALLEIRARKLYKEQGFRTFQEYCEQRWDFGRKRGYQLAEAAKLAHEVDVRGLPERAVRELAPLRHEPAQAQAAVAEATATAKAQGRPKPTAQDVKKAVARRKPARPGGGQSPTSAAQAALKARIEERKGEQALERDSYLEAALRSYEIVAEQLEAIDAEKLRGTLADLDPLHTHVTRAADIARRISVWCVRAGMTADEPVSVPVQHQPDNALSAESGAVAAVGQERSE